MPKRLAACEPCRLSKLACDHSRPICSRCLKSGQETDCIYRERPFKRNRTGSASRAKLKESNQRNPTTNPEETSRVTLRKYPNPGYLGKSSYVSIFGHLPDATGTDDLLRSARDTEGRPQEQLLPSVDGACVDQGARLLEQICTAPQILRCEDLIREWTSRGVNFALAGALVQACVEASSNLFKLLLNGSLDTIQASKDLFGNSSVPVSAASLSSIEDFSIGLRRHGIRWEILGLFFNAACRATVDVPHFDPLYATKGMKRNFQKTALHFSTRCLELSLSLDCLNDLQLFLQYEMFITYSFIEGDQSYRSWRQLGDVVSSLYALGYHEQTGDEVSTPVFLQDLRKAAFARAYSADKNLSIFLGRPPRIHSEYCRIKLPGQVLETLESDNPYSLQQKVHWPDEGEFGYVVDTQWAAICAFFKEKILDLRREKDLEERARKADDVQTGIEAQWRTLPHYLRLEGPLRLDDQSAIERDFAVSARVNYLHVLFLLRLAVSGKVATPDTQLLCTSAAMLGHIVDALVLKNHLVNSGTDLVWRVSYYGLPAAGVICIAILNQSITRGNEGLDVSKIFRDLSVLIAEVESGALLDDDQPNYKLMLEAVGAIKNLLDQTISGALTARTSINLQNDSLDQSLGLDNSRSWAPWTGQETYDFEVDFWHNLAEHPTLTG